MKSNERCNVCTSVNWTYSVESSVIIYSKSAYYIPFLSPVLTKLCTNIVDDICACATLHCAFGLLNLTKTFHLSVMLLVFINLNWKIQHAHKKHSARYMYQKILYVHTGVQWKCMSVIIISIQALHHTPQSCVNDTNITTPPHTP